MSEGIAGHIDPDEKLLWHGRPRQGLWLVGRDAILIPVSLFWAAGVAGIVFYAGGIPAFPVSLVVVLFAILVAYFIVGRFVRDAWVRARTEYALTNRRVLLLRPGRRLTSLDLTDLNDVRLKARGQRGDIVLGPETRFFPLFAMPSLNRVVALWTPSLDRAPRFEGIEDASRVFQQIESLKAARDGS